MNSKIKLFRNPSLAEEEGIDKIGIAPLFLRRDQMFDQKDLGEVEIDGYYDFLVFLILLPI